MPAEGIVHLTVVSVYAPTHRAPQEKKNEFYADLQTILHEVPTGDVLLVVGDFNARVGSSQRGSDNPAWYGVRGYHGVGKMNDSGEALLSFCALNQLTIMNRWFGKKDIYKYTWQHLGSKKWHCFDYVILKQGQRRMCHDVTVLRSAECWTDHKLVRAQLCLKLPPKVARANTRKKYAVLALCHENVRKQYSEMAFKEVEEAWSSEADGSSKWEQQMGDNQRWNDEGSRNSSWMGV